MRKFIITFILTFILLAKGYSQEFETDIGVRLGLFNGMAFRYAVKEKFAVEGILDSRWKGFEIIGLYEIYKDAFNCEQLKW